ncbi:growth factor receptor-bound protein 14 isoform X2 [Calliopsis andreniformis]
MPKMCACVDNSPAFSGRAAARVGSYQRLGTRSNDFEFDRTQPLSGIRYDGDGDDYYDETDGDGKQAEELCFYFDDETYNTLLVEKNLRAIDLSQLLQVKRNVNGISWSIIETWPELGIERSLEDHEDVLAVYNEMKVFASRHVRKFYFRTDFLKYELFLKPAWRKLGRTRSDCDRVFDGLEKQFMDRNDFSRYIGRSGSTRQIDRSFSLQQFLPDGMATLSAVIPGEGGKVIDAEVALRTHLMQDESQCPELFSLAWIRNGYYDIWRKVWMQLRDRKLYLAEKVSSGILKRPPKADLQISFAHLADYELYRITDAKKRFNSPFDWGICLRPASNAEAESTVLGESGLKIVTFHTEKSYICWLTAMRLAKYGKQLRENYRAFKNRQCEQSNGEHQREQYANVPNESIRSRVAMDFTGSVGRIVEDPKEAKDIAESEGMNWRRTWRPFSRTPPSCGMVRFHGLDDGIHVLQPWFHRGLKRDSAAAIIRDHGSVDGVFLVRESKSNVGAYVLTYKYSDKVFHAQIQPVFDERCNCWLYTLDKGVTKFYDLLQLIEFYQLNAGSLPTRLTHYVQNDVPAPAPRPEDGGASPSPPEPCVRFAANPTIVPNTNYPGHKSI